MTYTQKQLEAMSNFEVNWVVINLDASAEDTGIRFVVGETLWRTDCSGPIPFSDQVDYCNNHNDIMPLAHKAKIWLTFQSDLNARATASKFHNGEMIRVEHDNPLRAFAIVWVLINQGEKS